MGYVIAAIVVLLLVAGFVTFFVLNATKRSGKARRPATRAGGHAGRHRRARRVAARRHDRSTPGPPATRAASEGADGAQQPRVGDPGPEADRSRIPSSVARSPPVRVCARAGAGASKRQRRASRMPSTLPRTGATNPPPHRPGRPRRPGCVNGPARVRRSHDRPRRPHPRPARRPSRRPPHRPGPGPDPRPPTPGPEPAPLPPDPNPRPI